MKENKAFIGHSFTPEDQEVVGKFLRYFEQLEELIPNFEWDHAEAAEPLELAAKVKGKFAGKNLFIGICTRKEYAVTENALGGLMFRSDAKKVFVRDLGSKASDWVTQEIGFALGRGMNLLLLQEEGIRRPGGLQGDQEYIPFNRSRPELAFGKILEMLSALSPSITESATTADEPKYDVKAEAQASTENFWEPSPNWSIDNYRIALTHLTAADREDDARKLLETFAGTDLGKTPIKIVELESHFEFVKLVFGKGGSFDKLNEFAKAHPDSPDVLDNLAKAQRQFDNHIGAAQTFESASKATGDESESLSRLGRAALEYAEGGDSRRCEALVSEIRKRASGNYTLERQLAAVITDLLEFKKDEDGVLLSLERIVDLTPDNYQARFSLAYKHSQYGNEDLAFYHYLKIPYEERTAMGWNNLGVCYDHFKMPAASVGAYRKAEAMGETLAMANLGYKFVNEGFLMEAKGEFDKGFAVEDHHKNIEAGLSTMTDIGEGEEEKRKDVIAKLLPKAEFYRLLGQAVAADQLTELPSTLQAPECLLTLTVDGDRFQATGTYKRESSGLALALYGSNKDVREYKIEYTGRIVGRQIEASVKRSQISGPQYNTLLGLGEDKSKVFMFLAPDSGQFRVMENADSTSPAYYSLTVVKTHQ